MRDNAAVARTRPAGVEHAHEASGPGGHDADAVGQHRRFVEGVRDEQHRGLGLAPQPKQLVAHQQSRLLVEGAERLVQENEARLHDERAGDADALPHAARQLRRPRRGEGLEPHELDGVIDATPNLGRLCASTAQPECDVVPHAEPREGRVVLEDDADARRNRALHRAAFERHGAAARQRQAGDDVEQRRLAATRGSDDGKEFALAKLEVQGSERVDAVLERLRHCAHGHAGGRLRRRRRPAGGDVPGGRRTHFFVPAVASRTSERRTSGLS